LVQVVAVFKLSPDDERSSYSKASPATAARRTSAHAAAPQRVGTSRPAGKPVPKAISKPVKLTAPKASAPASPTKAASDDDWETF